MENYKKAGFFYMKFIFNFTDEKPQSEESILKGVTFNNLGKFFFDISIVGLNCKKLQKKRSYVEFES